MNPVLGYNALVTHLMIEGIINISSYREREKKNIRMMSFPNDLPVIVFSKGFQAIFAFLRALGHWETF